MVKKDELKKMFGTGKKPTGADFAELIDGVGAVSSVNGKVGEITGLAKQEDVEELTQQLVDTVNINKEVRINVKQPPFNAKGRVGHDDSDAIQSAIDYAFSLGDSSFPIIEFGAGTFEISKPIHFKQSGNYTDIIGAGIRQTRIKATSPMACMMYVSDSTGVHARKRITGITFDGNYLAECLLDGSYLRYSTIELNEFIRTKAGGYAVKLSNWVTRFLNNSINGQDVTGTNNPVSNGLLLTQETINNFVVENNSITSCVIGIRCDASPHDINIVQNTFDNCIGTGIWMRLGGRKVSIKDNYFEACGTSGVDVETANGTFERWYGAIVGHGIYSSLASTPFEGLNILYNEFANVSPQTVMSLANLYSFEINNNHTLKQYEYTHFVDLKWNGVPYNYARKAIIDHSSFDDQFTQLVGMNVTDRRYYASGLLINDRKQRKANDVEVNGIELINPSNWKIASGGTDWMSSEAGLFDGMFKIQKIESNTSSKEFTMDLSSTKGFRGQYFNCNVLTKGEPSTANGLRLRVLIDSVNVLDTSSTSEDWGNPFRNSTFYIPITANKLQIFVSPVLGTSPVYFTKFNISNANKPIESKSYLRGEF